MTNIEKFCEKLHIKAEDFQPKAKPEISDSERISALEDAMIEILLGGDTE